MAAFASSFASSLASWAFGSRQTTVWVALYENGRATGVVRSVQVAGTSVVDNLWNALDPDEFPKGGSFYEPLHSGPFDKTNAINPGVSVADLGVTGSALPGGPKPLIYNVAATTGAGAGAGFDDPATVEAANGWVSAAPAMDIPAWAQLPYAQDGHASFFAEYHIHFVNRTNELCQLAMANLLAMTYSGPEISGRAIACAFHSFGVGKTELGRQFVVRLSAVDSESMVAVRAAIAENPMIINKELALQWVDFSDGAVVVDIDVRELGGEKSFAFTVATITAMLREHARDAGIVVAKPTTVYSVVRALLARTAVFIMVDEVGYLNAEDDLGQIRGWLSDLFRYVFSGATPQHGLFTYVCGRTWYRSEDEAVSHASFMALARIRLDALEPRHVLELIRLREMNFEAADVQAIADAVTRATAGTPRHVQRLLSVLAAITVGSKLARKRRADVSEQVLAVAKYYARHEKFKADFSVMLKSGVQSAATRFNTIANRAVQCIRNVPLSEGNDLLVAQHQAQYMPFTLVPAAVAGTFTVSMNLHFMWAAHDHLWRWMLQHLALAYFPGYGDAADSREVDVLVALLSVLMPAALTAARPHAYSTPGFTVGGVVLLELVDVLLPQAVADGLRRSPIVLSAMALNPEQYVRGLVSLDAFDVHSQGRGFYCRPPPKPESADVFVWLGPVEGGPRGTRVKLLEFQVKAYERSELQPSAIPAELAKCVKVPDGVVKAASAFACDVWHFLVADTLGQGLHESVIEAGGCLVLLAGSSKTLGRTEIVVPRGVALFIPTAERFRQWQPPRMPPPANAIGVSSAGVKRPAEEKAEGGDSRGGKRARGS